MDQVGLRLRGVKLKFCIEIGSNALIDSSPMGLVQRVKQAEEAGVDSLYGFRRISFIGMPTLCWEVYRCKHRK